MIAAELRLVTCEAEAHRLCNLINGKIPEAVKYVTVVIVPQAI